MLYLLCVINIIYKYNMYSLEYKELFKVYTFLCAILLTQITCEHSYSELKPIKTRLRNSTIGNNLKTQFLINYKRELLLDIT